MASPETAAEKAVVHTELAGDATHQAGVFPPFDAHNFLPQIIWLVIIFGALYWLMSRVALPRVEGILEARRHRLDKDLGDAAAMQAQAKAAGEAYDKTLADARGRAQSLAQARNRAMANVSTIAQDTAVALVEHLTGKSPDRQAVDAAVSASVTAR